jgi:hypothetical protein
MRSAMTATILLLVGTCLAGPGFEPVSDVKYASYNSALNRYDAAKEPARYEQSLWAATDFDRFWPAAYVNTNQTRWSALDWGDIQDGAAIGGFTFGYGTKMDTDTATAMIAFYANDNGWGDTHKQILAVYEIPDLPGRRWSGAAEAWMITVDLDAQGTEFTIKGDDLDGDGLTDFGYLYWFTNAPQSVKLGPLNANGIDPNQIPPTCPGAENAFDKYLGWDPNDPNLATQYVGSYWFGKDYFAQLYMELFAAGQAGCPLSGAGGKHCTADIVPNDGDGAWNYNIDGDCMISVADLAQLMAHYGLTDVTHEEGDVWPENGDGIWEDGVDGDNVVGMADLAELLGQYNNACGAFTTQAAWGDAIIEPIPPQGCPHN